MWRVAGVCLGCPPRWGLKLQVLIWRFWQLEPDQGALSIWSWQGPPPHHLQTAPSHWVAHGESAGVSSCEDASHQAGHPRPHCDPNDFFRDPASKYSHKGLEPSHGPGGHRCPVHHAGAGLLAMRNGPCVCTLPSCSTPRGSHRRSVLSPLRLGPTCRGPPEAPWPLLGCL